MRTLRYSQTDKIVTFVTLSLYIKMCFRQQRLAHTGYIAIITKEKGCKTMERTEKKTRYATKVIVPAPGLLMAFCDGSEITGIYQRVEITSKEWNRQFDALSEQQGSGINGAYGDNQDGDTVYHYELDYLAPCSGAREEYKEQSFCLLRLYQRAGSALPDVKYYEIRRLYGNGSFDEDTDALVDWFPVYSAEATDKAFCLATNKDRLEYWRAGLEEEGALAKRA